MDESPIVRLDPDVLGLHPVTSEEKLAAPLDDFGHLADRPAVAAPRGAHADDVAIERIPGPARRDEDVILASPSAGEGRDESVALRLEVQGPDEFMAGLRRARLRGRAGAPLRLRDEERGGHGPAPSLRRTIGPGPLRRMFDGRLRPVSLAVVGRGAFVHELLQGGAQRLACCRAELELARDLVEGRSGRPHLAQGARDGLEINFHV